MTESEYQKTILRAKRGIIITFLVFVCILLTIAVSCCVLKYQHTFSERKWNESREDRYKIVDDMLDKYQIMGMSESDVIQLLGEEDSNDKTSFKISRKYFPAESTLVYWLGTEYMDDEWLIITISDGIVTEYCIDVT